MFQNAKTTAFVQWCLKTRVLLEENKSFCSSGLFLHKNTLFFIQNKKSCVFIGKNSSSFPFFSLKEKKRFFRNEPFYFLWILFFNTISFLTAFLWILFFSSAPFLFSQLFLSFNISCFSVLLLRTRKAFYSKKKNRKNKKIHGNPPGFVL